MGKLNLYRNISITFIIFVAMILCTLFLTFYSEASIIITPDPQVINLNFNVEVKTSSTDEELKKSDAIKGEITTTEISATGTFNVLSTKTTTNNNSSEIIIGKIKIKNDGKQPQTLVRTTQLQATDGTIVRTNKQVVIPAGGEVEVEVFPKNPATFSKLLAGRLTIIKLPLNLQEVIYGQADNELSMKNQEGQEIKFLAESDVNRAKKEIVDKAVAEAIDRNGGKNSNIIGEIISYSLDKKLGEETQEFTMNAKILLKQLNIDSNQLTKTILKRAQTLNQSESDLALTDIDLEKARYVIMEVNNNSYKIKVSYPLITKLKEDSEILAKNNFAGKTKEEIRNYTLKTNVIKDVEVLISPYWRKTTPKNPERIKIIIKQ